MIFTYILYMKLEKTKTCKKILYLNEDQYQLWSRTNTPKILRYVIENQEMIRFIVDNDITLDEIKNRYKLKKLTKDIPEIIGFLNNILTLLDKQYEEENDITPNEIRELRTL